MRHDEGYDRREEDAARQAEAAAILRRVRQETDPQIGAHAASMAAGLKGHFLAADSDPADRLEVIGTRIGRSLGLVAFALLGILLLYQIVQG